MNKLYIVTILLPILVAMLCFSPLAYSDEKTSSNTKSNKAKSSKANKAKMLFVAENLPPFHYQDANNQLKGALVEVIQALINQTSLDASIELMPFARGYHLAQKQDNVFLFSLLRTPTREQKFQWVGQTYKTRAYLVGLKSRNDIQIQHLNDAKMYLVATIRGYYAEDFLTTAGFTTNKNLSLSVKYDRMWPMLFKKRIDLILTNDIALDREISSIGLDPSAVRRYFAVDDFPNQLHIATGLTTSHATVTLLNQALKDLKHSGVYQTIINRWGL